MFFQLVLANFNFGYKPDGQPRFDR